MDWQAWVDRVDELVSCHPPRVLCIDLLSEPSSGRLGYYMSLLHEWNANQGVVGGQKRVQAARKQT